MSEQELKSLESLLPTRGGNRAFDRGVVEALEAAMKALASAPPEVLEPLRVLAAKAVDQEAYHKDVMARLDTPDSRREIEERLAKIRSDEIEMVPLEPLLLEIEAMEFGERNGHAGIGARASWGSE